MTGVDMRKLEFPATKTSRPTLELAAALLLSLCLAPASSHGQAAMEAGAATAASAGMTTAITSKPAAAIPSAAKSSSSAIPAPSENATPAAVPMGVREGPAIEEANRKAFEQRAGKEAAKLLLRSEPSQAIIYLDGKSVGLTPMLLLVAPGKYEVELRGQHQEFGSGAVVLAPNETRQYLVPLTQRFASSVTAHPSPSGLVTVHFDKPSNASVVSIGTAPRGAAVPAAHAAAPVPPVSSGPLPEEANRKLFEDQAGADAGKLALKSNPAEAQVYIDGVYVGRTPLEIRLAPGRYHVSMQGKDGETGEQFVGLLPQETQQVTLPLAAVYPGKVAVRWSQSGSESH
jgi:hypothetical protein